ncbi:MAG TPA: exopolysaccharide biosynthesis protein [Allosphingosinicella sp.]|nr:exopolysaccharide biosynthesis protein [Allosphingosinicella sp.]
MNKHSPLSHSGSLLERAAELYGFGSAPAAAPAPRPETPEAEPDRARRFLPALTETAAHVDRESLRQRGFIVPDSPVGPLAEEFRIVKRQLLLGMGAGSPVPADRRQTLLVCSAQPGEGKTFCAVNLALSLAGERDLEVLLVDADFPKPEILDILGLEAKGAGFVDALADPSLDPERLVIRTDVGSLSVLPAGRYEHDVPELLGSERTPEVLRRLTEARPKRVVIFDSPPALMASAAAALASHVGQLMLVVRADQTTEADLKEAAGLLSGCPQISLLLNGTGFAATGRRFGSYYGYGQ